MVSTFKLAKDLNNTSLEKSVSCLSSRDIELEQDKPPKTRSLKAEEIEDFEEDYDEDENELLLLSKRVNQLWKKRQGNKFKGVRRTGGRFESISAQKKSGGSKKVTCYEYKEPSHYKNDCPKLG